MASLPLPSRIIFPLKSIAGSMPCWKNITFSSLRPKYLRRKKNSLVMSIVLPLVMMYLRNENIPCHCKIWSLKEFVERTFFSVLRKCLKKTYIIRQTIPDKTEAHIIGSCFLKQIIHRNCSKSLQHVPWPCGKIVINIKIQVVLNLLLSEISLSDWLISEFFDQTNVYDVIVILCWQIHLNLHYGKRQTFPRHQNKSGNPSNNIQQSLTIFVWPFIFIYFPLV